MAETGTNGTTAPADSGSFLLLFGFRGSVSRKQYWLGLAVALVPAVLALILAGEAKSTTGGTSVVLLSIPLFVLFGWIYVAVGVKRLRDLGLPAWSYFVFFAAPLIAIIAAVELVEQLWGLIVLAAAAVLIVPGLLKSKAP